MGRLLARVLILMISAPISTIRRVTVGPARYWVKSSIRMPFKIISLPLGARAVIATIFVIVLVCSLACQRTQICCKDSKYSMISSKRPRT